MTNQSLDKIIKNLTSDIGYKIIPFDSFINELPASGHLLMRNIFQLFHDMVHFYVKEEKGEFPYDSEAVGFYNYNLDDLFINETNKPFFADRLFSNRVMNLANSFRASAARNKIYIFKGPAGSGKSTFLNNLLAKFEKYIRGDEGLLYEIVWRIPLEEVQHDFSGKKKSNESGSKPFVNLAQLCGNNKNGSTPSENAPSVRSADSSVRLAPGRCVGASSAGTFEVTCPSHDNPFLLIPKQYRSDLLKEIIPEGDFKKKLFKHKQYQWIFKDDPCTICLSIFNALMEKFMVEKVFSMIFARRFFFDRRQSVGLSVFNSGDDSDKALVRTNEQIQQFLNEFFKNSDKVKFSFSSYASTNQGIMALMDLKSKNVQRFLDLHGIISDEVHRVLDIEERIKSLFIVLANPGDLENVGEQNKKSESSIDLSLKDRIHEIMVPYVLDFNTEIKIYTNTFGEQIKLRFMPHVLENFAKTIISSRIKSESKAIADWIEDDSIYEKYCDPDFYILKMYLYAGIIPDWLSKEDRGSLKVEVRKNLLAEAEKDGHDGFSGRESNQLFDEFYMRYSKKRPIMMRHVYEYFVDETRDLKDKIPREFLKHLTDLYDFEVLKEVKDAMYDYNEDETGKTILNYLMAILHNLGDLFKNPYLDNDEFTVTQDFLDIVETHLIGHNAYPVVKERYRKDAIEEYASVTLAKEIKCEGKKITDTKQFQEMFTQFTKMARQNVLEPFAENANFRSAIMEFSTDGFSKYDTKIRDKVKLLFTNLNEKYGYNEECAKAVMIYVLDNKLHEKFDD